MSEIIKTEAVVLSKMDYGDTSKIATLYTNEFGKISAIIKGARSSKSKVGLQVDLFNHIQIVLYKKDTRELQILTQADIISHFPAIKSDLSKLKYSTAVLELINSLTLEGEVNTRLFRGLVRILSLFNSSEEPPNVLLTRFMIFFMKEIGYELQFENCSFCEKSLLKEDKIFFSVEKGLLCKSCKDHYIGAYSISQELFNFLVCLTMKKSKLMNFKEVDSAIFFLEKFLKYHIPEFKGIKSIYLY